MEIELPPWKQELDAIVGARHGGQINALLTRLQDLDRRFPNVAQINHQLAWTCDVLGRSDEALPYYERAVALGLPENELSNALIGLGSTLRVLGQLQRSRDVLEAGRIQFKENREFDAFLALTLHSLSDYARSAQLLLNLLLETSEDIGIAAHQRALRFHASRLTAGS